VVLIVLEKSRAPALRSADWIARQRRKVEAGTKALAEQLGARQWFVGSQFGLADIAVGCMLGYLDCRLPEFEWRGACPELVDFAESLRARPSFASTIPQPQEIAEVR
jgi:glutathione S-transferase